MLDLLITRGLIVDGTGSEPFWGSVGVKDGVIALVSRDEEPQHEAARTVDAQGQAIAPGFIDLHSHADFTIQGAPHAETQAAQGVTTALTGNCGATPFPAKSLDDIRRDHAHLDPDFKGEWTDLAGYRAVNESLNPAIDLLYQVGLSSVRAFVVGDDDRPATQPEMARMKDEIRKAADQGAVGFSSGLIYAPGSYASQEEVTELVRTAAECGLLYSTHMRNESGQVLEAVEEAIATAEAAGARLEISHLKAMGPENHGKTERALELIEAARERGVDVAADVYPYTASSTTLTSRLPAFAMDGGKPALLRRLADRTVRADIAEGLKSRFGRDVDPAGVVIAELGAATGESMDWTVGLSLQEIGERDGCPPEEAALRVLEAHGAAVAIVNHAMNEDDVRGVLRYPLVSVASDGWTMTATGSGKPHPRSFGTFVRLLGKYVRDERVLTLQEAVRKMTSLPASRLQLDDRGVLAEGKRADIVLIDTANVRENATFEDPWQLANGVTRF